MRNPQQEFLSRQFLGLARSLVALLALVLSTSASAAEITSPFGWRLHPITGKYAFHSGLDIGYAEGTPIVAMKSGTVVYAAAYGDYGNCIILEHPGGEYTLYAHCATLNALYGDVRRGEIIASVGSTGASTGPHLHLEWWQNGQYRDPLGLWEE